jgi:superfamily II DNA/RNA helicase
MFFSATMTPAVKTIIDTLSMHPVMISVKKQESSANVDQDVIKINGRSKVDVLDEILRKEGVEKTLVFGRTKWGIENLSKQLTGRGLNVTSLHGNKNQNQRQRSLDLFRQSKVRILLATDIMARGIDVDDITHVINYDLPETYEDYVHRIGRTGRNNKKGIAISFVD